MIRQSFCYPLFRAERAQLEGLFTTARQIGYEAVELWFREDNFDELCRAASKSGLKVASMCGHRDIKRGLNNRSDHDRIVAELRQSIDIAAARGIGGVICFSGNAIPGQTDADAREACATGLKRIASHAERAGVNVNLELLNSKVNHPGYLCDTTAWGADVVRRVGSPRIKLLYDIYHMQIMEGDVIRTMRDNVDIIGHMHTAGNPGRGDFDDVELPQELNYRGICRAISATGYAGFVGHEFTPGGDKLAALKAAFDVCNVP